MPLSGRDKVRLEVGDTDSTDPLLTDDEVDNFLTDRAVIDSDGGTIAINIAAAAADCAGAISAKYARKFDFSEDGQSFHVSQRVGHFQALEQRLRARAGGVAIPYGGTVPAIF